MNSPLLNTVIGIVSFSLGFKIGTILTISIINLALSIIVKATPSSKPPIATLSSIYIAIILSLIYILTATDQHTIPYILIAAIPITFMLVSAYELIKSLPSIWIPLVIIIPILSVWLLPPHFMAKPSIILIILIGYLHLSKSYHFIFPNLFFHLSVLLATLTLDVALYNKLGASFILAILSQLSLSISIIFLMAKSLQELHQSSYHKAQLANMLDKYIRTEAASIDLIAFVYREIWGFLEDTKHLILIIDLDGKVIRANKNAKWLWGYELSNLIGLNLLKSINESDDLYPLKRAIEKVKAGNPMEQIEVYKNDGTVLELFIAKHVQPPFTKGTLNKLKDYIIVLGHDKTRDANLIEELIEKNKQLEEINKKKNKFMENISHDIKTPLNSIIGFTQVLLHREKLPTEARFLVTRIYYQARRLLDIFDSLLFVSNLNIPKITTSNHTDSYSLGKIVDIIIETAKKSMIPFQILHSLTEKELNIKIIANIRLFTYFITYLISYLSYNADSPELSANLWVELNEKLYLMLQVDYISILETSKVGNLVLKDMMDILNIELKDDNVIAIPFKYA